MMRKNLSVFGGVVALAMVLAACGAPGQAVAPPEPTHDEFVVAGYHPWWTQDAWREYDPAVYDEIYFFSVEVDSAGGIAERNGWPDRWFTMQSELDRVGVRVTPVVTLFSNRAFERLFATPESSAQLSESLLALLRDSPGAGGLQIDFEIYQTVSSEVRDNFTSFVRRLRGAMDSVRPDLVLSLYMLAYDESDVFDEAALATVADYLVVQGYDLHSRREDRTGPVAGLEGWGNRNWNSIVARLTGLGIPEHKIVMSVPYFGYEWPAESAEPGAPTRGAGRTISYAPVDTVYSRSRLSSAMEAAAMHGARRDVDSGSPYYAFQDSTGWRQGWFEDPESLERKYAWVAERGLGGVAVFPPAYGTEELEALLREHFPHRGL